MHKADWLRLEVRRVGGLGSQSLRSRSARLALRHLTTNSKVGTDQAVGNTAWHADTGRERLQQGCHVIVCNVRPHLSLRLGAAPALPFLRGPISPARAQPLRLLPLLLLKTVSEGGASARVAIASKGVAWDTGRGFHVAALFRFLSQSRVSVRIAGSVALGHRERRSHWSALPTDCPRQCEGLSRATTHRPDAARLWPCPRSTGNTQGNRTANTQESSTSGGQELKLGHTMKYPKEAHR